MRKIVHMMACVLFLAGPAMAHSFDNSPVYADKIVPLPAPNPLYTNHDADTVLLGPLPQQGFNTWRVALENDYSLERWKEWLLDATVTPLEPLDWSLEVHVEYLTPIEPPPTSGPQFIRLNFWDVVGAGSGGLSWPAGVADGFTRVIGYPLFIPDEFGTPVTPLRVDPNDPTVEGVFDMEVPPYGQENPPDEYFWWNPEYVSLQFTGYNVQVDYDFTDWCVPEPATMSLLALGGVALLRRRR